jgi:hypothetical protein
MSSYLRAQLIGLLAVKFIGVTVFYGKHNWVVGSLFVMAFAVFGFVRDRRKRAERGPLSCAGASCTGE